MADAPHPPRQAKWPGRGKGTHHKIETAEERHARTMLRPAEELCLTRHCLQPGHHHHHHDKQPHPDKDVT